jgi:hypothetical protein
VVSPAVLIFIPIRVFSRCYRYENDEKSVKMVIFE